MSIQRVAVLTVHSCPKAALGGKETGGMNVYVRELSREMGRLGVKVDVYTRSQNPHISPMARIGPNVRVIHIRAGPEEPLPKNDLLRFLPEFTAGVVQFAAKNRGPYDLIHSHYWLSGWVGGELKKAWSIPLVHMFHTLGSLKNSFSRNRKEREPGKRIRVEEEIMGFADGLVAPNSWEKEQMVLRHGASPAKIRIIPCGVNLSLFRPIASASAKRILGLSEKPFILFVGRIDAIKGIDVLIEATHALSGRSLSRPLDLGVIIIGGELDSDPQKETREMQRLRRLVARKKLQDRVAFWGSQRQALLPYFYSASEALVIPSRYESFGIVALEAMACGTPVVASRVGGLQYTVKNGKTGFLTPEGDWRVLAERIKEIILKPALKERLGRSAMIRARMYGWPLITRKVLSFYEAVTGQGQQNSG